MKMNTAKKNKGVTLMYDCIYGKRGFCAIKRNMNCDNDCSYYVEPERDDGRLTIADEKEEVAAAIEEVFDEDLLINEEKKKERQEKEKVLDTKRAIWDIQNTFKIFINDLRAKYLDKPTVKDENENDNIGGTD
jgi:hypothetical protein